MVSRHCLHGLLSLTSIAFDYFFTKLKKWNFLFSVKNTRYNPNQNKKIQEKHNTTTSKSRKVEKQTQ